MDKTTLPEINPEDSEKDILTEAPEAPAGETPTTREEKSKTDPISVDDIIVEINSATVEDTAGLPEGGFRPNRGKYRIRPIVLMPALIAVILAATALILVTELRQREDIEPVRTEQTAEPTPAETPKPSTVYIPSAVTPGYTMDGDKPNLDSEKEAEAAVGADVVEKTVLHWGIDVSEHQKDIDWSAAAMTGLDFAMIRVGYRGYTYGDIFEDEYFRKNMNGAIENGVPVGVYFFSQAVSEEEAVDEANYVLRKIKNYNITYPIVFDWEYMDGAESRTAAMTYDEITKCADAFCKTIADAGYTPMIYFSQSSAILHFDLSQLTDYEFWLADYSDAPYFYLDYQMWQFTASGSLDGITGDVDKNYCFKDYAKSTVQITEPEVSVTFEPANN